MPAMDPRSAMPDLFAAGTTVKLERSHRAFPASAGFTLKLLVQGPSQLVKSFSASGDKFTITLTAVETAALAAGRYRWEEEVTETATGDVATAAWGYVQVTPDLEAAAAGSLQSEAEKTLSVLKAKRDGRLASDLESYQIDGMSVAKIPFEDLDQLIRRYEQAVARERNGGKLGRIHYAAFRGK